VFAPANTPLDVVAKLNRAVAEIQKDGQIQKKIESLAMDVSVGSPQELSTMLAKESDFYSVILKRTNTKLD
jgi:tripartite-type tricarboxylate transporter receptor subunit TctC